MKKIAIVFMAAVLAACGDTQTAYLLEGDANHSISVIREQAYFRGPWRTTLIVAGLPECQRRYPMDEPADGQFSVEVHRPAPGTFILHAGKRWHVAALEGCAYQTYKVPPPVPGEVVGRFEMKAGALRYTPRTPPPGGSGAAAAGR